MGKNFQVQLEKIGGAARDAMGTLQKGIDVLESFGIISGDTATALSGAVSNISGGIGAITGGYEAITKKGATFFDVIGGGLDMLGGLGTIATTVIGGLIALFTGDGIQEAIDRENAWMGLSKELNDQIHKLAEEIGTVHAATTQFLTEIMQENLKTDNFDQYADRIREIQADVQQGTLTQEEANKAMGESFAYLAKKAAEYGKEGTYYMLQILRQNRDMGQEVAEINQYVLDKLQNTGITGLNTYIKTLQGTLKENQSFVEGSVLALFGALEQEGYSYLEIVGMMSGSLTDLAAKANIEGVQISGAIREMLDLTTFINNNQTLIQNIEATRQIMTALGDSSYLTRERFTAFGQEALKQFQLLMAAGANEKDALRILGPELEQLIKYAESYGIAIDDQTAALIEKARTEGALNAESLSESDKQRKLLEEIVKLLGGEIPYGIRTIQERLSTSMPEMISQTGEFRGSLGGINDDLNTIKGNMNSLDDTWKNVVSGNTLIAENDKYRASLGDVNTGIHTLQTAMASVDQQSGEKILNIINNIQNWQNKIANLKSQQELFPGDYAVWEQLLNQAINNMNIDVSTLQAYLEDLGYTFSSDLPLEIDTLAAYFQGMVNNMSTDATGLQSQVQDLIFDYQTLQSLGDLNPLGDDLGNYGIYTQEQIDAAAGKFQNMQTLSGSILEKGNLTYMQNFLRGLEALTGPLEETNLGPALERLIDDFNHRIDTIKHKGNIKPGEGEIIKINKEDGENEPPEDIKKPNIRPIIPKRTIPKVRTQPTPTTTTTAVAPGKGQEVYALYIENFQVQGTTDPELLARQLLEVWRRDTGHYQSEVIATIGRKLNAQNLL